MNFQAARLETFYLTNIFTTKEKICITEKGLYKEVDRLKCYKCSTTYEIILISMDDIGSHQCGTPQIISAPNVDIPSPYIVTEGAIDVRKHLKYKEFRYATFRNWCPVSTIKTGPLELAASGFYYAANPQTIKCFYCKTILHARVKWNILLGYHKNNNRKCADKKMDYSSCLIQYRRGPSSRRLPRISEQAGPLRLYAADYFPEIESPMACHLVQRAFDEFLSDGEKSVIYTEALDLGLNRRLVTMVVKQQLQLQRTIANVEELIELCYIFTGKPSIGPYDFSGN